MASRKNGIDEHVCKEEIDTDVENRCMDTKRAWDELEIEIDVHILQFISYR